MVSIFSSKYFLLCLQLSIKPNTMMKRVNDNRVSLISVNVLYFSESLRLKWNCQHVFAFCELDYFVWKCIKLMNCGRGVQAFPLLKSADTGMSGKSLQASVFCLCPSLPLPMVSYFCKWSWYKRRLRAIIATSRKDCPLYLSSKECLPCASGGHGDRGKPGFFCMDSSLQQIFTV